MTKKIVLNNLPRLSEVNDLTELGAGKHERTDQPKYRSYATNRTLQCDCKQFELKINLSTGKTLSQQMEYCVCGHVRKKHINSKNHCFAKWIEKNENINVKI